jgi:magnesium transporter
MTDAESKRSKRSSNRRASRLHHPVGTSPGTLSSAPDAQAPVLSAYVYCREEVVRYEPKTASEAAALRKPDRILWLDVSGLADMALIRELGERFALHPLALEDVVNAQQRAKIEDYSDQESLFLVLRAVNPGERLDTEQFSLFLGDGFVITFQERKGDSFGLVRERLMKVAGRLRQSGPDYLAYALLDAMVDAYFPELERIGDRLDSTEEQILLSKGDGHLIGELHDVRRDLLGLRRSLWPLREVMHTLVRGDISRFSADTRVYLRDVHDHVVQLIDLLENYRELGASLMEVHLATASQRLNEVMKVLTVIATIFIPLTFLVGVYGMNFQHMPELHWEYGYALCWAVMLTLGFGMAFWFRKRGWI